MVGFDIDNDYFFKSLGTDLLQLVDDETRKPSVVTEK